MGMKTEVSNEYKDWLNDLTDEQKLNYDLCVRYPILIPHHRGWGTVIKDYQYEYTELDAMPNGWKQAFGEQWAQEVQQALNLLPESVRDKVYITDIKEKYGFLHTYFSYYTDQLDKVIHKYSKLSQKFCIGCGKKATVFSTTWISPWCDDCCKKIHDTVVPIDVFLKEQE